MNVTNEKRLSSNHRIQIGTASWDTQVLSVRSAYYQDNGKFNYAGSAEVSTNDLIEMIKFAIKERHLTVEQTKEIQEVIGENCVH